MLSCLWDGTYKRSFAANQKDFLSWTEEPMKTDNCAHDRRALQQLVLNEHIKSSLCSGGSTFPVSLSLTGPLSHV